MWSTKYDAVVVLEKGVKEDELMTMSRTALIKRAREACPWELIIEFENQHWFWLRMDYVMAISEWENPGVVCGDPSAEANEISERCRRVLSNGKDSKTQIETPYKYEIVPIEWESV